MKNLDEDTYILGLWLVVGQIDDIPYVDYLFSITRDKTDFFKWDIFSRTRLYKDDEVFISNDIKEFTNFSLTGTEDDVISQLLINLNEVKDTIEQEGMKSEVKSLIVKGNIDKFIEVSKECDFVHMKTINKEELEKQKI